MYKLKFEYFNSDYFKATQKKRSRIFYIIFSLLAVACLFIEFILFASPETVKAFSQGGYVNNNLVEDIPLDFLNNYTSWYMPFNKVISDSSNPVYDLSLNVAFDDSINDQISYQKETIDGVSYSHFYLPEFVSGTYTDSYGALHFSLNGSNFSNFTGNITFAISYFNGGSSSASDNRFKNSLTIAQASSVTSDLFNSTTPTYRSFSKPCQGSLQTDFIIQFYTDIYIRDIKVELGNFSGFVSDLYNPNGYNVGYSNGYNVGFNDGETSVTGQGLSFLQFLNAVVSAPLNAVLQIFDVNILGYNMKSLLASLLSISLILLVIKFILGHVGSDSE